MNHHCSSAIPVNDAVLQLVNNEYSSPRPKALTV